MRINNMHQQVNFGEKYPVERLISCACEKPFIRKSDSVNIITSILKLTKSEKKEMLHHDSIFQQLLKKTGEYITEQLPEIKLFAMSMDNSTEARQDYILNLAEEKLGSEINLKRLSRSKESRVNKIWNT